jgi:hypothetical protein
VPSAAAAQLHDCMGETPFPFLIMTGLTSTQARVTLACCSLPRQLLPSRPAFKFKKLSQRAGVRSAAAALQPARYILATLTLPLATTPRQSMRCCKACSAQMRRLGRTICFQVRSASACVCLFV